MFLQLISPFCIYKIAKDSLFLEFCQISLKKGFLERFQIGLDSDLRDKNSLVSLLENNIMLLSLRTPSVVIYFLSVCCLCSISCKKFNEGEEKPKWAQKDLSFYNDADLERLFDQWEVRLHLLDCLSYSLHFTKYLLNCVCCTYT